MVPSRPAHACRWWWPWLMSLALHGILFAVFSRVSHSTGVKKSEGIIDTRVSAHAAELEVRLTLEEPAPPRLPVGLIPALPRVAPPVVPAVDAPPPSDNSDLQPASVRDPRVAGAASKHGGNGQGGTGVTTAFFQTAARGQSVVYVLDRSISMGINGALPRVKRALLESLERLPADARFQVIFFNRVAEPMRVDNHAGLLAASHANLRHLNRHLEALAAEGGTDYLPALQLALTLEPDVIFFLTDANDLSPEQVRAITSLNHGRSVIHALDLGPPEHAPMRTLAHANRGVYRALNHGAVNKQ